MNKEKKNPFFLLSFFLASTLAMGITVKGVIIFDFDSNSQITAIFTNLNRQKRLWEKK